MKKHLNSLIAALCAIAGVLSVSSCDMDSSYGIEITNIIENHSSHSVEGNSMGGLSFSLTPGQKCSLDVNTVLNFEPTLEDLKHWNNPFTHGWLNGLTIDGNYYMILDDKVPEGMTSAYEIYNYYNSIDPLMYEHWENISFSVDKATFKFTITDEFIDSIINRK